MLELTRAANYLCDKVRESLFRGYRLEQGVLLVERGPSMDLTNRIYRTEYRGPERTRQPWPYPGLQEFRKVRHTRDTTIGYGGCVAEEKAAEREAQQAAAHGPGTAEAAPGQ